MGATCKHGVDPRFCAACQLAGEAERLRPDALQVTREGKPALLLRIGFGSGNVTVLVLDGAAGHLATMDGGAMRAPDSTNALDRREVLDLFRRVALQLGYLFHPEHALTTREQTAEGPARCYSCRTELSLAKHSLGCTQCRYYVCQCRRCLCGYTGKTTSDSSSVSFPRSRFRGRSVWSSFEL